MFAFGSIRYVVRLTTTFCLIWPHWKLHPGGSGTKEERSANPQAPGGGAEC